MSVVGPNTIDELLLARSGLVFLGSAISKADPTDLGAREKLLLAFDLELAQLGYVASVRLRERLKAALPAELVAVRELVANVNAKVTGGHRKLEPLFRRFPEGIPDDTFTLWWDRVVVCFLQEPDQPCVLCRRTGTIHALNPCAHLVCDRCFDGSNYSGCPICNRKVDRASPFFGPAPPRAKGPPPDRRRFALLDLGNWAPERTQKAASRELFVSLCQRTAVLSPVDLDALTLLLRAYRDDILAWLPEQIPVRENLALIFGALLRGLVADASGRSAASLGALFGVLTPRLTSATDVLRLLCAYSGAPVSLLPQPGIRPTHDPKAAKRFVGRATTKPGWITISHHRFAVAKLPRALRRECLAALDRFPLDRLLEDLGRHASRWVWVAQLLHPGEYAKRYPTIARAFSALRNGRDASAPRPWPSAVAAALEQRRFAAALALLEQRPGELLRRLDALLRQTPDPGAALAAFLAVAPSTATPALFTLRAHLASRGQHHAARVYWPKAGYHVPPDPADARPLLSAALIAEATARLDEELLRRFAAKPHYPLAVLDEELAAVTSPFCERTASKGAVQLPRGSTLPLPASKQLRLFIHWCQPQGGERTDIDLSVGFFDETWQLRGTCAYYVLQTLDHRGHTVAASSGDFTAAPWPDGAAEFVDVDRELARAAGYRYAVMVINAYSGLPFHALARASAGVMLRDGTAGDVFDPASVELAFALGGEHGIFMPLVLDLEEGVLHWLDVYAKGQLAFNNVASSQGDIARVCPAMLRYFASRPRPTMLELGRLHAAARAARVIVRRRDAHGALSHGELVRASDESPERFLARLRSEPGRPLSAAGLPAALGAAPVLALLHQGDLPMPDGSAVYAVFRRKVIPTLAAADLLA